MVTLQVAHLMVQGVNLIIVPLAPDFGQKLPVAQRQVVDEIQVRARSAGLAGTVVPVWDAGAGRMGFVAPTNWHPYFQSISLSHVYSNLNRTLSW